MTQQQTIEIGSALYALRDGTVENPTRVFGPVMRKGEVVEPDGTWSVQRGANGLYALVLEEPTPEYTARRKARADAAAATEAARSRDLAALRTAYTAATTVEQLRDVLTAAADDGFGFGEIARTG